MNIVRSWRVRLLRVVGVSMPPIMPEEKRTWQEFGRRVWHAKWIIAAITVVMWFADSRGLFHSFEMAHLDSMIRLRPREMSQNIVLVEISEADYHDWFDGTSPLDKLKLLDLVLAVKKYNPSVIGVDIDTNDWISPCKKRKVDARCAAKCDQLGTKLQTLREMGQPLPGSTKQASAIVWAAVPKSLEPPLELNPGLGGMPLESDSQGIPRFPIDPDGSVRHFESRVDVAKRGDSCPEAAQNEGGKCYVPTLARAILKEYVRSPDPGWDKPVIFNFYGDRYRFPIIESRQFFPAEVKDETRTKDEIETENKEIEASRAALLAGKVVLIGGAYAEARDAYFTPLGPMQGVELNALAIQTDLSGGGIREINRIGELLSDVVISIFVVWVFYWYETRPWLALVVTSSVVGAGSIGLSLVLFNNTAAYWFNFIPAAFGMVCHQLYELAKGGAESQRKLEELTREPEQVEIGVASVEEVAVTESTEVGRVDEIPSVDDQKVKGVAGGAH